jgi:hypothetical protein
MKKPRKRHASLSPDKGKKHLILSSTFSQSLQYRKIASDHIKIQPATNSKMRQNHQIYQQPNKKHTFLTPDGKNTHLFTRNLRSIRKYEVNSELRRDSRRSRRPRLHERKWSLWWVQVWCHFFPRLRKC